MQAGRAGECYTKACLSLADPKKRLITGDLEENTDGTPYMNSTIVIITGLSGTGKTTLGKKLAASLSLPFISKDIIKEFLFDNLGYSDRAWSKKLGIASFKIMDYFIEEQLKSGCSLILETNFNPKIATSKFQGWQATYNFKAFQIVCHCRSDVLFERCKRRVETGERHPGHADHQTFDKLRESLLHSTSEPLKLEGEVIEVDTTEFAVDTEELIRRVREYLVK